MSIRWRDQVADRGNQDMATFITDNLASIDALVETYAETVFVNFGGPLTTSIRLAGIVALALLGANTIFQWTPLQVTDFLKWGMRYVIVLMVATSWAQFEPIYNIVTDVPSSIGAELLDAGGGATLNEAMDNMVTGIFDFSDRAAEESGYFSINLLSIVLAIVGALMACVAIVVAGIAKIGLAMAVSLAPVFIACLLFKATSDLFSSWARFTLGFALIPLVLAGVMGIIIRIGEDMILEVQTAGTLTDAAGFLIVAMAAIFLMSQVPTMVNRLAGTVVATASGVREMNQMRAVAVATGRGGGAVLSAASPAVKAVAPAGRAASQAESGNRGTVFGQELIASYQARKQNIERNQPRLATLGQRSSLGDDFRAGQARQEQYARRRWRELSAAKKSGADGPASDPSSTPKTRKT